MHRGTKRTLGAEIDTHFGRMAVRSPTKKGRKAWVEWALTAVLSAPGTALVGLHRSGARAKPVIMLLTAALIEDHWGVIATRIDSRTFDINDGEMPIAIHDHVIDRMLERGDYDSPVAAVEALAPVIWATISLMRGSTETFLLPAEGGAVIVPRDRGLVETNPEARILITFVDGEKLKSDQRAEMRMWMEKAA
jgi:hypothetical protein